MLPVNMPQSAPYAAGPLSGYFGGAMFNNAQQNQQLNAQQEDLQNQTMQHALDQLRLNDPLEAAKRQVGLGQQGIEQTQLDSGEALATRQAQDKQKQSKAFADMSNDEITKAENVRVATYDVSQHMDDQDYMLNPERWKADKKYLESHGVKGLPDVLDPMFKQRFQQQAQKAPDDLKSIRLQRAAKAAADAQMERTKVTAAATVEASQNRIQTQRDLASANLDPDKKIILAADTEYQQSNGKMSAETAIQAKNVIRSQILASEEGKNLDAEVQSYKNGLLLKPKELAEKAKAANLDPSETDAQKIVELGTLERNKRLTAIVDSKFKDRWPHVTIINKQGPLNPRQVAPGSEPATNPVTPTQGLGTNKVSGTIGAGNGSPPAAQPVGKPASAYTVGARVRDENGHPGTIGNKGQFVPD